MRTWSDIVASDDVRILAWACTTPWAEAMRGCQQDALWHAEGDVWTHTRMVCAELPRLEGWSDLGRDEQLILLFTALFHDSGKPATTALDPETGRLRSHRHSIVGTEIARRELRVLDCPLRLREHICNLVRYHGRPPYLLDRPDPERHVIWHSWLLCNRLLHLFALADARGRFASETSRTEQLLDLWRTTAQESGCWDAGYAFANEQARYLFYRDKLNSLHFTPNNSHRCTVTVMSGVPASGKDTWLSTKRPELPVVSLDELRREMGVAPEDNQGTMLQAARECCRVHLRAGEDFAFNATNTTGQMRQRWLNLFAEYDARIEIVYLEVPRKSLLRRNAKRREPVPESVILRLLDHCEPPMISEAHKCTWIHSLEKEQEISELA